MKKLMVCLGILSIFGCSTMPDKGANQVGEKTETVHGRARNQVNNEARKAAQELGGDVVSTIVFKPGTRGVPTAAVDELDHAIREARQHGEIESIDIAVWSDLRYPSKGKKLPQRQVDLAEDRGENIERYLNTREPDANVKIHNMAKQPSALAELLRTQDAAVKEKLVAMGIASPTKNDLEDRSSSALIFIKVRE